MNNISEAISIIRQGGVIAYPTEAVYGLGCDPYNETAIQRLLSIKKRRPEKGLILIADDFEKVKPLVDLEKVTQEQLNTVLKTWPGPYTWIFPIKKVMSQPPQADVPRLVRGIQKHDTLAVRISAHPIVRDLCRALNTPLISTSANREGDLPLRTAEAVKSYFGDELDYVLEGSTSGLANPTEIRDVLTGKVLRNS